MNLKIISGMLAISALTGCATQGYVQTTNAVAVPAATTIYTTPVYTAPVYVSPWYYPYRHWGYRHHRGRCRW